MDDHCPRCGGCIHEERTYYGVAPEIKIGRCATCGQQFHGRRADRPVLTGEDWAVLTAHDESERRGKPDEETTP